MKLELSKRGEKLDSKDNERVGILLSFFGPPGLRLPLSPKGELRVGQYSAIDEYSFGMLIKIDEVERSVARDGEENYF